MARPTAAELSFALSFLKYTGVKDPRANAYLLLAIVAWLRQESGGLSHVIGNNPFNIRQSPYAIGYRKGRVGSFAIFASLDAGARASVALLKSDGAHGWRGYGLILRAALRAAGSEKDKQRQAIDFLNALALSKWDASHYGTKAGMSGDELTAANHLIRVWASLLGSKFVIPADPVKPGVPPKKPHPAKPKPIQQDDKVYITPIPVYIQPYAAFSFYEERHWVPDGPPGDTPK